MHVLIRVFLGGLLLYVGYCGLLFVFQRFMLFPRYQVEAPSGMERNVSDLEKIWLQASFGKVEAWFIQPAMSHRIEPAPAVIFAHGNAELVDFWPEQLKTFTSLGLGVLLVEYPGYGRSEGSPSQKSITEAFVAAYDWLVEKADVDPTRIVMFGRSLGGGVVCALAAERQAAALVLMSTFTSVRACAIKFLAPSFLVLDPFDNLRVVSSYSGPVLVVHGRNDNLIPYEHGLTLSRTAQRGRMVTYECRHNDCPPSWAEFWRDVESFLVDFEIIPSSR